MYCIAFLFIANITATLNGELKYELQYQNVLTIRKHKNTQPLQHWYCESQLRETHLDRMCQ